MTFQHFDYRTKVFFECFKLIENVQSVDISLCEKYYGCQSIQNFQRNKKRCCCVCQFQDRFDLTFLNQVKFDLKKLVWLYNEILIALVEIKILPKSIMDEDIFYIFNNEKIYLEEMIIFSFYFQMKSKNLAAFISFIIIIASLFSRK